MTTLKPGYEADYQGRPPIYEIGCAGVITDVEELSGGRFNIVLRGVVKVSRHRRGREPLLQAGERRDAARGA
jgi:Lon protease-like protein